MQNAAKMYDVTTGTNGTCGTILCKAGIGWDGPTGYGTPNASAIVANNTGTGGGSDTGSGAAVTAPATVTVAAAAAVVAARAAVAQAASATAMWSAAVRPVARAQASACSWRSAPW